MTVSRRRFVGGVAGALGYLTFHSPYELWAGGTAGGAQQGDEYDSLAKLAFNENPWGPSEPVMEAMHRAFKYSQRYGYPDGNIVEEIAKHHDVEPENVMLGAGSGEILNVVGAAFLLGNRKVLGVEPTF